MTKKWFKTLLSYPNDLIGYSYDIIEETGFPLKNCGNDDNVVLKHYCYTRMILSGIHMISLKRLDSCLKIANDVFDIDLIIKCSDE